MLQLEITKEDLGSPLAARAVDIAHPSGANHRNISTQIYAVSIHSQNEERRNVGSTVADPSPAEPPDKSNLNRCSYCDGRLFQSLMFQRHLV
jgi:hypothetical protein